MINVDPQYITIWASYKATSGADSFDPLTGTEPFEYSIFSFLIALLPMTPEPLPDGTTNNTSLHQYALDAVGQDSAVVHGANMIAPILAAKPSGFLAQLTNGHPMDNSSPIANSEDGAPDHFVLTGKIDLFGREDLTVEFYSYHGPPPQATSDEVLEEDEAPVYQMAILGRDRKIALSSLIPQFSGTPFDTIAVENIHFIYQNMIIDQTKNLGFTIQADIVLDESHGQIHQVLNKFLGISDPMVHLSCELGVLQDWHKPLSLSSFQIEGVLRDATPQPALGSMDIHSIGVRLIGSHSMRYNEDGSLSPSKTYSYTVFGEVGLEILPMPVSFEISECGDSVSLTLSLDSEWNHAFRIPELTLEGLNLSTTFDLQDIKSSLEFDVAAVMDIGTAVISLDGQYSMDGSYSLTTSFPQLSFHHLGGIFSHFYSGELAEPDLDVDIGYTTLNISGDSDSTAFSLDIYDLTVGDYGASEVEVDLGSGGVTFKVKFDDKLSYLCGDHPVDIENAHAEITFIPDRKNSDGTVIKGTTDVLISGTIEWETYTLSAGLHLYRCPETGNLQFTILAQFVSSSGLAISHIIPGLENTLLNDITLQDAGLAIASRNDPQLGALRVPCQLKQGVQVYAILGEVPAVNKVMKEPQQLILRAGWEKAFSAELDIFCHAPHIDFRHGIVVDDISLRVILDANPRLSISGGVKIPINHQSDPNDWLDFTMTLTMHAESAEVEGALTSKDGWNNPFDISDKLTINTVHLLIGINYLTGPQEVGFSGAFRVDEVPANVKFLVSEVPSKELLSGTLGRLTLSNVVDFTNSLLRVDLPMPPDVIVFEKIEFCLVPAGTTFANQVYPPGFSFSAAVILFGINANAMVEIGKSRVQCAGLVDPFSIGPLSVSGTTPGQPAKLEICLTKDRHYGMIGGSICIFGVQSKLKVNFEMHPALTFGFLFVLQFAGIFDLEVEATKAVVVSSTNPSVTEGDYTLKAEFHQAIRDHVNQKINELFKEKARLESQEASEKEKALDAEKQRWQEDINRKEAALDQALKKKEALIAQKKAEVSKALDDQKAAAQARQKALDEKQAALRKDIADAKAKFAVDTAKATQALKHAEQELEKERKDWDGKLDEAHRKLDEATRNLHNKFSNTQNTIATAKAKVGSLQTQIDGVSRRISDCHNAHWYDLPAKAAIPGLEIEKAGLMAAKAVADAALVVANKFIQESDYLTCDVAVKALDAGLRELQAESDKAILLLERGLEGAQKDVKALDGALDGILDAVTKEASVAIDVLKKALETAQKLVIDAEKAINSVEASLGEDAAFVGYGVAAAALATAKASGSAALTIAKAGVQVYNAVDQELLKVWDAILSDLEKLVDVTDVTITGELGEAVKDGFAFDAEIKGTFNGDNFFHFSIKYDHNQVEAFFKSLFDKLVKLVEGGVLNPAKEIIRAVEDGGSMVIKYGPNGTYSIQHV